MGVIEGSEHHAAIIAAYSKERSAQPALPEWHSLPAELRIAFIGVYGSGAVNAIDLAINHLASNANG